MTTDAATDRPMLAGSRVLLRPLQDSDVGPRYLAWLSDPQVNRFLESRLRPWTIDELRRHVRADAGNPAACSLAICLLDSGQHVGNVRLSAIDRFHGNASLGILIGERHCHGRGCGTEAIVLACRHAFASFGLRRVRALPVSGLVMGQPVNGTATVAGGAIDFEGTAGQEKLKYRVDVGGGCSTFGRDLGIHVVYQSFYSEIMGSIDRIPDAVMVGLLLPMALRQRDNAYM